MTFNVYKSIINNLANNLKFIAVVIFFCFYSQSLIPVSSQINTIIVTIICLALLIFGSSVRRKIKVFYSDLLCLCLIILLIVSFFLKVNILTDKDTIILAISTILFFWVFKSDFRKNNSISKLSFYVIMLVLIVFVQVVIQFINSRYTDFAGNYFNSGVVAAFFCLGIPFILYKIQQIKTIRNSLFFIFLFGFMLAYFIAFKSRNGLLITVIDFIYLFFQIEKSKKKPVYIIGVSLICCFLIYYLKLKSTSITGRILVWKIIYNHMNFNGWIGVGVGNFKNAYVNAQSLFIINNESLANRLDLYDHAYNDFVQTIYECGLVFFLIYLLFYYIYPLKIILKSNLNKLEKSLLIMVILNFFIVSITFYNFYTFPCHLLYIIVLAFVYSKENISLSLRNFWVLNFVKIFILVLILSKTIIYCNLLSRWRSSYLHYLAGNDIFIKEYRELKVSSLKSNSDFLFNYGAILYNSDKFKESIEIFNMITGTYPGVNFYILKGNAYLNLKMFPEARKCFFIADGFFRNDLDVKIAIRNISLALGDKQTFKLYNKQINNLKPHEYEKN